MKRFFIFILVSILAASCTKEEYPKNDIVGKWSLVTVSDTNTNNEKIYAEYNDTRYYEFNEDGTGRIVNLEYASDLASITEISYWNVYGDNLIIKTNASSSTAQMFMFRELNKDEMILWLYYEDYRVREYTFRRR